MATEALKILAIDDTPDNLITLKAVVRDALPGAAVVTALSGPQGIALARAEDPDVILLDIVLPGMDGYAICRALKADERLRPIPVVFLTALRADRESRLQALEAGAEAFLAKPLDEVELIAQIRAMAKIKAANQMQRLEREQLAALVAERTRELEQELAERKRIEDVLRESEEKYRLLVEMSPDGIGMAGPDGRLLLANRQVATLFGYADPAEMAGVNLFELFAPEERGRATENFGSVLQRGVALEAEYVMVRRDGTRFYASINGALQRDANGAPRTLIGLIRDISERKRAEEALHDERDRAQGYLDTVETIIVALNSEGRITTINRKGCQLLGCGEGELIGQFWFSTCLPQPDGIENMYPFFLRMMAGELAATEYFENPIVTRSGELRQIAWHNALLRDEQGRITGTLSSGEDITERKRAEAERARLLAQVQAQAQQIAQLMATVPEGVLLLAADGQVLLANPAGVRDLATLAGVAVGERLIHLGDLPLAELLVAAERGGPWREVRVSRRIFEAIARPVSANSPAAGHWVLVINDVTQARDLRDQLQQQERLAAVGQLAAGIAHDFNNILAIIALQAPLVARASGLTERDRERLTIISEQTGHATRLIQQLLDFSRCAVLERRPLDLEPLLKEQVKLLARTLPETIQVTLACEPGEYVVLADPTRLQQMLMNLAVNARDAMPTGGALRLTLTRQATTPRPGLLAGPWVRLEVTDSGTGIAAEAQAHLFEPFFTTKPHGQGTGLGLAQVHGIVKQHEGEIAVHSAVGQGATFTIYLPAVAEAASAPAVAVAAAATQAGGGETILLVEDNAVLLDAMSDIVGMLGYEVVGAGNGEEALAVLEAQGDAIALVLSDLVMPVMGGEALFQAMRARGFTTPVVMQSGHPLEGELAGLKAQGLAGWLLKPPEVEQLAQLLAQVLASRRG